MSEAISIASVVRDVAEANEDTGEVAVAVVISHKPTDSWSEKFKEAVEDVGIVARIGSHSTDTAIWLNAEPGQIQERYDELKEAIAKVNSELAEAAANREKEEHQRLLKKSALEGLAINELQRLKE